MKFSSFSICSSVSSSEGNAFLRFIWRMEGEIRNRVSPVLVPKANNGECGICTVSPAFSQKMYSCGPGVYVSLFRQSNLTI